VLEPGQERVRVDARDDTVADLARRQVADTAEDVVQRVGCRGARAVRTMLEVGLDLLQRARVDQVPQLLLAEELAQEVASPSYMNVAT